MPLKRSLNNPNPVKYQATDLLSGAKSRAEICDSSSDDDAVGASAVQHAFMSSSEPPVAPSTSTEIPTRVMPDAHGGGSEAILPPSSAETQSRGFPHALSGGLVAPMSPATNRDRFLQGFLPARTCCNLDLCRAPAGSKFSLTAVCIAVFPASTNPDRRYIQLADITGTVGITVWNDNVQKFTSESVGALVALGKVAISSHHGKKQLTMTRDSVAEILDDPTHHVFEWWQQLLGQRARECGCVQDVADNTIISVVGICGHVTVENRMVQGVSKTLTTAHLVDASGRVDIKSWNHDARFFQQYVDRPVLFKRIRVTSFAGTKMCEMLDGAGSIIETEFPGKISLAKFWSA
jgi:hypothetical protein